LNFSSNIGYDIKEESLLHNAADDIDVSQMNYGFCYANTKYLTFITVQNI